MASPLGRLVTKAIDQAESEHNPIAELTELQDSLMLQFNRIQMVVHAKRQAENDQPDKMTCCHECGGMMPTPKRGGSYICNRCTDDMPLW